MAVVEIKHGYKYYGRKSNTTIVLNNLNMTVQPGTIYGLLGASGCGKTTLLSCIVGHRRLNDGEICIFGRKPGDVHVVSKIGYMPQEFALVPEMSIKQSVFYFGQIYGMSKENMQEKFERLQMLLDLPPASHLVKNCSGGQQRRVSFACALIHDPELLILDEPTVGLDPMLRDKIWHFLGETTRRSKTAVIITTHYIEEARQAHCVGFMRNGVLLTEDSPSNVISRFGVNSLEEAFLRLSQKQGDTCNSSFPQLISCDPQQKQQQQHKRSTENGHGTMCNNEKMDNINNILSKRPCSYDILKALLSKNFSKMRRNILMLCFLLVMPVIAAFCFVSSVGIHLKGLKLGIVNMETTSCNDLNVTSVEMVDDVCHMSNISCHFIRTIRSTDFINPILYDDLALAHRDAKRTSIIGYIHIPENFSAAMQSRLEDGRFADEYTLEHTLMDTHLDMTAGQSVYYTELKLMKHFQNFISEILGNCDMPEHIASGPVKFNEPIYGSEDADTQRYMAPGFVLTFVFFLNTLISANIFIEERSDGVWDRTVIAGATPNQFLLSHIFTQFLISIPQNTEFLLFLEWVFRTNFQGSKVAFTTLLFLLSTSGMFFGLLLSIYCKTHTNANYVVTGTFYVMVSLCGLIWPLEGMPSFLQKIVAFTPFALPSTSARNIIEKGWAITHRGVYEGYVIIIAWIIIFYGVCLIGIKRRH